MSEQEKIVRITPTIALAGALLREPERLGEALTEIDSCPVKVPAGTDSEVRDERLLRSLRFVRDSGTTLDLAVLDGQLRDAALLQILRLQGGDVHLWPNVDTAAKRVVEETVRKAMVAATKSDASADTIAVQIEKLRASLPDAEDAHTRTDNEWHEVVRASVDPEKPTRIAIPSGVPALDKYIRDGWGVGELSVIALPTNEGKSMIAATLTRNIQWPNAMRRVASSQRLLPLRSMTDAYALLVTLEDPARTVMHRWTCDLLDVPTEDLDSPERRPATLAERAHLHGRYVADLTGPDARVKVVDAEMLTKDGSSNQIERVVRYMRGWASRIRKQRASRGDTEPRLLVIIDHVQTLITTPDTKQNRERELALISERLDAFARDEQVAVVCTAMLNGRAGADAHDVEIRESAAIEQKASLSIKAHSCQSFQRELAEAVAAKIAEKPEDESLITERWNLAKECHTWRIHKSRNTGGRDCYVTTRAQWDRTRITRLSDAECKIADHPMILGNMVGWARKLVAERASDMRKLGAPAKPGGRRKKPVTGSDEIET